MSSIPVETAEAQARAAAERGLLYVMPGLRRREGRHRGGALPSWPADGGSRGAGNARAGGHGTTRPCGAAGTGQLCKLINQGIVASTLVAMAEAMTLARQGGADPLKVREALLGGFADSTILKQHALRMATGDFVPAGQRNIS